ncbi:hypothetical protein JDV02_005278 [Purpureocillium takamizusanense]|uniref:Uncharacterized protein n=1 Tax=Purpureocillium takamizusanense TaxID=2060973 RepID=A0A9Q8QH16_9HYPO|nr:uncharacterized protein JDV02_005278 [Purpureocillium takamizusanense]UNI19061.1 hypothetical protein JDV02_005278 [Purpureocillium takamizusanense]
MLPEDEGLVLRICIAHPASMDRSGSIGNNSFLRAHLCPAGTFWIVEGSGVEAACKGRVRLARRARTGTEGLVNASSSLWKIPGGPISPSPHQGIIVTADQHP